MVKRIYNSNKYLLNCKVELKRVQKVSLGKVGRGIRKDPLGEEPVDTFGDLVRCERLEDPTVAISHITPPHVEEGVKALR